MFPLVLSLNDFIQITWDLIIFLISFNICAESIGNLLYLNVSSMQTAKLRKFLLKYSQPYNQEFHRILLLEL